MRSHARAFLRTTIFVGLNVLLSFSKVLAVIVASAVCHRHALSVFVLHLPVRTGAAFRAHLFTSVSSDGNLPTRVLTAVHASFENFTWRASDGAFRNVFPPITDVVAFSPARVSVSSQVVADALDFCCFISAKTMIGDAIFEIGSHVNDSSAFLEGVAIENIAGCFGG